MKRSMDMHVVVHELCWAETRTFCRKSRKVSACGEERHPTFRHKLLYSTLACVTDGRRAFLPPIAADLLAGDQIFVFTRLEIVKAT